MNPAFLRALLFCLTMPVTVPALAHIGTLDYRLGTHLYAEVRTSASEASTATPLHLQTATQVRDSIIRELVLLKGTAMLGTDYVLGANRDDAVDCSALVQQMFGSAGIELPRTSRELVSVGRPVRVSELAPGDLLFYRWGRRGLHVGVYMAEGMILHASTGRREVVMTALNQKWNRHMVAARRPM